MNRPSDSPWKSESADWLCHRQWLADGDEKPRADGRATLAFDLLSFTLFIGLDVGKSEHHATALTRDGEKVYDKPLPNTEAKLTELLRSLTVEHGRALLVVDQPATIGALPVAVLSPRRTWKWPTYRD